MTKKVLQALVLLLIMSRANAQDWPNLKKYREANSKVPPPAKGEKRVVWMGDSITDFWLNNDSTFFAGKPYYDRGISGQTTGQIWYGFGKTSLI